MVLPVGGVVEVGVPAPLVVGEGGQWRLDLAHELRHSRLTRLAEAGIQLPLLMTKGHHTSLHSLAIAR